MPEATIPASRAASFAQPAHRRSWPVSFWMGVALATLVVPGMFLGDWLYPGSPTALHVTAALQPPSWRFPLGTDELGRDMLARLFSGGTTTLVVSVPATVLTLAIGTAYGITAGLGPAWLDATLMRLLDAVLALPMLMVLIFFASLVSLTPTGLVLLLGLVAWPGLARLLRNETISIRDRDFITASRQLGASPWRIGRVHMLRQLAPLLVVNTSLLSGEMIFSLSSLSFLGLGVQPPQTSWGGLLEDGLAMISLDPWWMIVAPGLMVFAAMFAASLIGENMFVEKR